MLIQFKITVDSKIEVYFIIHRLSRESKLRRRSCSPQHPLLILDRPSYKVPNTIYPLLFAPLTGHRFLPLYQLRRIHAASLSIPTFIFFPYSRRSLYQVEVAWDSFKNLDILTPAVFLLLYVVKIMSRVSVRPHLYPFESFFRCGDVFTMEVEASNVFIEKRNKTAPRRLEYIIIAYPC